MNIFVSVGRNFSYISFFFGGGGDGKAENAIGEWAVWIREGVKPAKRDIQYMNNSWLAGPPQFALV